MIVAKVLVVLLWLNQGRNTVVHVMDLVLHKGAHVYDLYPKIIVHGVDAISQGVKNN